MRFCKSYVYQKRALNVRFDKNHFNAWVVICKHKAFRGMVKCMFFHTMSFTHVFSLQNACITYGKKTYVKRMVLDPCV